MPTPQIKLNRDTRTALVLAVTGLMFLINLISFPKYWSADRSFPNVPLFRFLTDVPSFVHLIIFYILILSSTLLILKCRSRRAGFILPLILAFSFSWFLDVLRLQPQFYLALVFLVLIAFDKGILNLQRVIILVYFWAGLQKLSFAWAEKFFPVYLKQLSFFANFEHIPLFFGIMAALFECSIAFLLFFRATRIGGVYAATFLHLFILLLLGPLTMNWEPFVWSWNVWMIAVVWLLFYKKNEALKLFKGGFLGLLVSFLFILAPFGSYFGTWNDYLAFRFYSATARAGHIVYPQDSPYKEHSVFKDFPYKKNGVSIDGWGYSETGANNFPSDWYFKDLFWQVCQKMKIKSGQPDFKLRIHKVEGFWKLKAVKTETTCE